jgi:hypothetical protein
MACPGGAILRCEGYLFSVAVGSSESEFESFALDSSVIAYHSTNHCLTAVNGRQSVVYFL